MVRPRIAKVCVLIALERCNKSVMNAEDVELIPRGGLIT